MRLQKIQLLKMCLLKIRLPKMCLIHLTSKYLRKKEWSVQVGNATVKVNGSADALPADAQLSVTEITSEDEVKEIEKQ